MPSSVDLDTVAFLMPCRVLIGDEENGYAGTDNDGD